MLPSYTSLIKKLQKFSKALTVMFNIFYCHINQRRHQERHPWHRKRHQEEWYLHFVTSYVTKKKKLLDFRLFKALITVGLPFTWILQHRLFPAKMKSWSTLQKCRSGFYILWVLIRLHPPIVYWSSKRYMYGKHLGKIT